MADLLSELELFEQELKELGEDVSQTSTSENSKKLQDMPSNSQVCLILFVFIRRANCRLSQFCTPSFETKEFLLSASPS